MRWKAVVMHEVIKKQHGRCPLCHETFSAERELAIERTSPRANPLELASYRAVHEQCHPVRNKEETREERLERIVKLMKEKRSQMEIIRDVGISLRTYYRYMNAIEREQAVK